jgi:tetratricopeptide (TPR) repeat protein
MANATGDDLSDIRGTSAAGSFLAARVADADFNFGLASRLLEDAISFEPEEAELRQSLMSTYLAAGNFEKAKPLAAEFNTDPFIGRLARQIQFVDAIRTKRYAEALRIIEREELQPDMQVEILMDRLLMAWTLMGQKKIDEAIELASDSVEFNWYPIFTNFHVGLMLDRAGRRDEAKSRFVTTIEYPRATATAPDTVVRAIEALVRLHLIDGEIDEARMALQEGRNLIPSHPPFLALQKRIDATEEERKAMPKLGPMTAGIASGVADVFFTLGKALDRQGAEAFVNQLYRLGLAASPKHVPLRLSVAALMENVEHFADANELYAQVPETSDYYNLAQIQTALNLNSLEEVDASISAMSAAIDANPNDQTAVIAFAAILMNADKYDRAATLLDRYIEERPEITRNEWLALYRRGMAFDKLDRWPEAEADFLKALDVYPNQPQVLNYLGYTWVDMGINLERGLKMLETAVRLRPNTGYIVDSLGWAHYRLGNYDLAVQNLEEAVLLQPTDPTIIDHLGDAYWRVGRQLEARYKWAQSLEQGPEDSARKIILKKLDEGLTEDVLREANAGRDRSN